jgi:catechol 2,3-dioxygenase-like lactoylglutathione lyase family enzyme
MLDHFGFIVRHIGASRPFYEAALAPLGLAVTEDRGRELILARPDRPGPFLFIGEGRPTFWTATAEAGRSPAHFAFQAPDRAAVEAFYAAGLAAGGRDNGAPGIRRPGYYAAFLLDPDGNNIEAGVREG